MNVAGKSPSPVRVAVIASAFVVLASAVTPAHAATLAPTQPVAKQRVPKKRPPAPPPAPAPDRGNLGGGGNGGPFSLDWTLAAGLRP